MSAADEKRTVSRADLEAKLREIKGEVETTAQAAKAPVLAIGAAAAVVVVLGAYLLGRRRGRKRTTVVEIKRV